MSFEGRDLTCVRGERLVFEGLNFTLPPGAVLIVRGPNGAGKSSLLRLVAGLLRPAAGTLTWDGGAIADAPEAHARRLHFLGHLDAVKPAFTVEANLRFWARLHGQNDGGAITDALQRLGLGPLADAPARLLSAGQRRRLALARLAAASAPLWCLDEPTVGLDEAATHTLTELIAKHRATGGRLLLATHQNLDLDGATDLRLDGAA
jgi:heme exporter protein A